GMVLPVNGQSGLVRGSHRDRGGTSHEKSPQDPMELWRSSGRVWIRLLLSAAVVLVWRRPGADNDLLVRLWLLAGHGVLSMPDRSPHASSASSPAQVGRPSSGRRANLSRGIGWIGYRRPAKRTLVSCPTASS